MAHQIPKFEVFILGSGSATPTTKRNPSSQILTYFKELYLIDCGEGTQLQLKKNQFSLLKINHIFISHLHGDHFFGLPGLIASMSLLNRTSELSIYGSPHMEQMLNNIFEHTLTRVAFPIKFIDTTCSAKKQILETSTMQVFTFPLNHRIATHGFLFIEKLATTNRSYAYCCDTLYTESLVPFIQNTSVIYHDATFTNELQDRAAVTFHSTAAQAAQMAKLCHSSKLILGHFSSRYDNLDRFLLEAKPIFENTELAIEGTSILIE